VVIIKSSTCCEWPYTLGQYRASYEANDSEYTIPGTELKVLTYGPYDLAWGYENHIILTNKKNIP
jgi:hypothetical protein